MLPSLTQILSHGHKHCHSNRSGLTHGLTCTNWMKYYSSTTKDRGHVNGKVVSITSRFHVSLNFSCNSLLAPALRLSRKFRQPLLLSGGSHEWSLRMIASYYLWAVPAVCRKALLLPTAYTWLHSTTPSCFFGSFVFGHLACAKQLLVQYFTTNWKAFFTKWMLLFLVLK